MKYFSMVLMPIRVSAGVYCWNRVLRVCGHFSNEGGHPHCALGFDPLLEDRVGRVLKPKECRNLEAVK